ncbi:MAG: nuclear transport factor 2 family protein [Pseudomonadota bacterium]
MTTTMEGAPAVKEEIERFFQDFRAATSEHDIERIRRFFSTSEDVSIFTLWRHMRGRSGLEEWLAFVSDRGRHLKHEKDEAWHISVHGNIALVDSELAILHPDYGHTPLPCRFSCALVREGEPPGWRMLRYHMSERSALPRPNPK